MTIDGKMPGDLVTDQSANVEVDIHVRAPSWAPVDHLVVYTNSGAIVADIAITTGTDFTTKVMVAPTQDAWVVAEVRGSSNMFPVLSATEFPPLDVSAIIGALAVGIDLSSLPITAKLQPQRLHFSTPYAITNPIWIDHDGDGKFTAPLPPLATTPRATPGSTHPDVRAAFDALPECVAKVTRCVAICSSHLPGQPRAPGAIRSRRCARSWSKLEPCELTVMIGYRPGSR